MSQNRTYYPVIIVGAGPTGLTLANLLGAYGVEVLLIERNAATVGEPRAVSIDDESLRTMQAVGLVQAVISRIVQGYGSEYYSQTGRMFLTVQPTDQPYGYPRRNAFRQPILEAQLRNGLERFANVTTLFSHTLRDFTETPAGVRVEIEGATSLTVECDYLIGCDGAGSTVRSRLGISLSGKSFEERWLIVDLENASAPSANTFVFCDPARPCIALPGPNRTHRFEFKLHSHEAAEDMLRPDVVSALLTRFGASPDSTLARKCVYKFHARLAERWGSQRVFLAGDAAHLTPPFAGQGMNSGIRDAHNLAWKLAFVLSGRVGAGLLESYELERRDHVQQMIQLALRMGRIMAPSSLFSSWLIQSAFRILRAWPRVHDYFAEMKYKPKPGFKQGFLIAQRLKSRRALVGRLLPQPWVERADGTRVLLDDVLGSGFALLCHEADIPLSLELALCSILRQLDTRLVAVAAAGRAPKRRANFEIVVDASGHFPRSLAQYRKTALLIRPDHYVAAVLPLTDLELAVERLKNLVTATLPSAAPAVPTSAAASESTGEVRAALTESEHYA